MTRDEQYDEALVLMENYVHHLADQLEPPMLTTVAKISYGYRYSEKGAVRGNRTFRAISGGLILKSHTDQRFARS